jgi:hypothetical protein
MARVSSGTELTLVVSPGRHLIADIATTALDTGDITSAG